MKWADGDSSDKTVDITIYDDEVFEGDETIQLELDHPEFVTGGASVGLSAASVVIVDNEEPGEIQFSSTEYTVAENGGYIEITVERINGNTPVSIDYATSDNTAVAGTDYTAASGTLYFSKNDTSRSFRVYITNNYQVEDNKTINLTLSNPQSGLRLGSPTTATLTIEEDDVPAIPGEISIENASYSVNEGAGTLEVTLVRSNGSDGLVSVTAALFDDTAIAGNDFNTRSSNIVTFMDGQTTANVSIRIIDDSDIETDETFRLELSNPDGGVSIAGTTSATITIVDNDTGSGGSTTNPGRFVFLGFSMAVKESAGTVNITVERLSGSDGAVTVDYVMYTDGANAFPATMGDDYTPGSGSLTFADGISSQTISLSIVDDTEVEFDESFNIRLQNPTGGASINGATPFVISILDNDESDQQGGTGGSDANNGNPNTGSSGGNGGSDSEGAGSVNPLLLIGMLLAFGFMRRACYSTPG